MTWIDFLPAVLLAVLFFYVPGAVIGTCLKFRRGLALALAPAFSTAAVGVAGVACGALGITWGVLPYMVVSGLLGVAAALITRRFPWQYREFRWRNCLPYTAGLLALALIAFNFIRLVGSPTNPSQVFDNVFHLNAIRYIVETGNASSLTLASIQGVSGLDAVYPAAWHTFAAFLVQLTVLDIAAAQNAVNFVVAGIIWPASCLLLVSQAISRRPAAMILTAVVAASQVAFPYMMIVWGPLFPYALALSMLPAVLTAVLALAGIGRTSATPRRSWLVAVILGGTGLAFAHTSSVNIMLAVSAPIIMVLWWRWGRRLLSTSPGYIRIGLLTLASMVALATAAVSWFTIRPAYYDNWGPTVTPGAAVGEVLTASPMELALPAVVISALSVCGLYAIVRTRRHGWLLACYAVIAFLYVAAATLPKGLLRDAIVGTWYQDTYRLAALLPLVTTPLAVLGGLYIWNKWQASAAAARLTKAMERRIKRFQGRGPVVLGTAATLVLVLFASLAGPLIHYISGSSVVYRYNAESYMLTPDERNLLQRLGEHVPAGAVIADNPWNGSSLAYAYAGRPVLTSHLFAQQDSVHEVINERLQFEPGSPDVCSAIHDEGVEFVLDFGSRYIIDLPGAHDYPGVTDIAPEAGFELVDFEGPHAKLYRIRGCP